MRSSSQDASFDPSGLEESPGPLHVSPQTGACMRYHECRPSLFGVWPRQAMMLDSTLSRGAPSRRPQRSRLPKVELHSITVRILRGSHWESRGVCRPEAVHEPWTTPILLLLTMAKMLLLMTMII